jgi:hypothetical protein
MMIFTLPLLVNFGAEARPAQVVKNDTVVKAIPWAYKLVQTPELVLDFLNNKTFVDVRITVTYRESPAFHIFYIPGGGPELTGNWRLMKTGSFTDLMSFLNNKVKPPFCWQPRICAAVNKNKAEHYLFYKSLNQPAPGLWQWQQIPDVEGLKNQMNSKAGEQQPQKDVEVFWLQDHFYMIYQTTAQKKGWNLTKKVPFDEVVKFLNGKPPYSGSHSHARIAGRDEEGLPVFYVYYR